MKIPLNDCLIEVGDDVQDQSITYVHLKIEAEIERIRENLESLQYDVDVMIEGIETG